MDLLGTDRGLFIVDNRHCEVLTAVTLNVTIFWCVVPFSPV
jgi:hypothetical protein